ncbi:hypothetical protein V5799_025454 [Amblyomma americanum]|uniref:Rab-GAP TBC domain-containing protein n=1 Tax=Amblyomma americanum TaxID=6943 RepID=A0AAQ4E9M2_AMBAM
MLLSLPAGGRVQGQAHKKRQQNRKKQSKSHWQPVQDPTGDRHDVDQSPEKGPAAGTAAAHAPSRPRPRPEPQKTGSKTAKSGQKATSSRSRIPQETATTRTRAPGRPGNRNSGESRMHGFQSQVVVRPSGHGCPVATAALPCRPSLDTAPAEPETQLPDRVMAVPKCFKQEFVDVAKLPQPIPGSPTPVSRAYSDVIHLIRHEKTKEAKSMVRTQHWPMDHPNRGELWLQLCQLHLKGGGRHLAAGFYQSTVRESLGELWPMSLPAFADPIFCEDYLLSAEGQKRAERVLYVVSVSHPHITYCPLLHPVTSLLLHYLSEEQAYECVCSLIESTAVRHLSQTRLMHDTSAYALMQLTRRLARKTYARLLRRVQEEEDLEKVFHTWELWIFRGLPLYHLHGCSTSS